MVLADSSSRFSAIKSAFSLKF